MLSAGRLCTVGGACYNTCKFALDGFFSAFAMELLQAKDKFTVTLLMPGYIGM